MKLVIQYCANSPYKIACQVEKDNDIFFFNFEKWSLKEKKIPGGIQVFPGKPFALIEKDRKFKIKFIKSFKESMGCTSLQDAVEDILENIPSKESLINVKQEDNKMFEKNTLKQLRKNLSVQRLCWVFVNCYDFNIDAFQPPYYVTKNNYKDIRYNVRKLLKGELPQKEIDRTFSILLKHKVIVKKGRLKPDLEKCKYICCGCNFKLPPKIGVDLVKDLTKNIKTEDVKVANDCIKKLKLPNHGIIENVNLKKLLQESDFTKEPIRVKPKDLKITNKSNDIIIVLFLLIIFVYKFILGVLL